MCVIASLLLLLLLLSIIALFIFLTKSNFLYVAVLPLASCLHCGLVYILILLFSCVSCTSIFFPSEHGLLWNYTTWMFPPKCFWLGCIKVKFPTDSPFWTLFHLHLSKIMLLVSKFVLHYPVACNSKLIVFTVISGVINIQGVNGRQMRLWRLLFGCCSSPECEISN